MIPFEPQPLKQLQERYAEAIDIVWVADKNMVDRPGLHRENVFDTEDGIRLIISKDLSPNGKEYIHFSGSVKESIYVDDISVEWKDVFTQKFDEITKHKNNYQLITVTQGGIPHWIVL